MAYMNGKKILQVVRSVGGSGGGSALLTTTTDATESSGTYTLALTYLSDTPNVNDYVVYVDNESLSTLYQVTAVDSTNATLDKIGDIGGGGKQLYRHIIYNGASDNYGLIIDTNSPTKMTWNQIKQFLVNNGYTSTDDNGNVNNSYPIVFGISTLNTFIGITLGVQININNNKFIWHNSQFGTTGKATKSWTMTNTPTHYTVIAL